MAPPQSLWDKLKMLPKLGKLAAMTPKHVSSGAEPGGVVREPDLGKLPVLTTWPHDGGPFITLPQVITRDPETGIRNVGMYRLQVLGPRRLAMHWQLHKTATAHYRAYRKRGERMPVAIALGGDPALTYCASAPLPPNVDEYLFAGFLRGEAVRMVKGVATDLDVPADADLVIEGFVDTSAPLVREGPFGDHTGFYSLADDYPPSTSSRSRTAGRDLPGHRGRAAAGRGSVARQGHGADVPADAPDDLPGDRRHGHAGGGRVPQPLPHLDQEGVPRPGEEGHPRPVGLGPDGADQDPRRLRRRRGRAGRLAGRLARLRERGREARPRGRRGPVDVLDHAARTSPFGGKIGVDATQKWPEEGGASGRRCASTRPRWSRGWTRSTSGVPGAPPPRRPRIAPPPAASWTPPSGGSPGTVPLPGRGARARGARDVRPDRPRTTCSTA